MQTRDSLSPLTPGFVKQHGKRSRSAAHQCTDGDMLAQVLLRAPLQMRVVGKMTPDTDKATCCRDTSQKGIVGNQRLGRERRWHECGCLLICLRLLLAYDAERVSRVDGPTDVDY